MPFFGSASTQRELGKLTDAGLLVKKEVGKIVLYRAMQPHRASIDEAIKSANAPIFPCELAASSAAMYSVRRSTRTMVQG